MATTPADIHVTPINDLREHVESRDCWCRPRIESQEWLSAPTLASHLGFPAVVVHSSLDGRELVEQHGVN